MSLLLPLPWALHLAATLAMTGAIWVVQLAIYPLFVSIGRAEFPAYHRRYTARIGAVVAPLILLEAATGLWLWLAGLRTPAFTVSLGLLGLIWASTFFLQVPLHRRLAAGFDADLHRRLVRTNWLRTLAWTARAGLLLTLWRG